MNWKQYALLGLTSFFQPHNSSSDICVTNRSAYEPRNHFEPKFERIEFFDPKRDKHHVGGCFVAVKLGKAGEGRQDTKIFGPRCSAARAAVCSFCPDLKGSLQWPPAKTCFNGGLWSANNLGGGKKLLGCLRGGGGGVCFHIRCVCVLSLSWRWVNFAFQVGTKLNHRWQGTNQPLVKQPWFPL